MKTRIVAIACVVMLATAGVAQAAEISSPGIFGVIFQHVAECVVLNGGNAPLAVTLKISNSAGAVLATSTCGGPLGPRQFCATSVGTGGGLSISENFPVSCSATAGSIANLRGALTIHELASDGSGGFDLQAVRSGPLR